MKKINVAIILAMTAILIFINTAFYYNTRKNLIDAQEQSIEIVSKNVKSALETNYRGEKLFDDMLGDKLYTASIAVEKALPPHIKDVSNEQLVQLSKELGVDDITLLVKDSKDSHSFIGAKSSDSKEIGAETKDWGANWNRMFSQLMDKHSVTLEKNWGMSLPNYWAGPYSISSTHPGLMEKWGYYNDGTTDYLIDPYMGEKRYESYQKEAGVNGLIQNAIKENPFLIEIGVVNYNALVGTDKKSKEELRTHSLVLSHRFVPFGNLHYQHPLEKDLATKAIEGGNTLTSVVNINGRDILKTYIPITLNLEGNIVHNKMIAIVASNYDIIQQALYNKELQSLLISLICFVFGLLFTLLLTRYVTKQGILITQVQRIFSDNIERLFKTVKAHRHDFNHHIFTIQGLLGMRRYEEAQEYIRNLTRIQTTINDVIPVDIPALNGLLQAKIAEGMDKQIRFEHHFEGFEVVSLDTMKITNLVRILGNILDNAYHAVESNPNDNRRVILRAKVKKGLLVFDIHNNGEPIAPEHLSRIFEYGFTTRENQGGTGIGLASSKKIIEGYKGEITVTSNKDWTTFTINLPLSQRELIQAV
ncbi:ATP-binding protein (plasmid) [Aneurinibacillus sp. Ricciae_BoGa-3]|uniref:sensor histidine kinase n=1 Tax=Aneurinibacillus sp. Ricciae_BoGa-3 TaxID=3022697 RepID=UPI00234235D4|nr:ATP-binding protein [Aneurinibacillus sp. Ricciae_BoGa-3]WCK57310.1 ATP-binding protein [Aneurinibacillus sp. Ricciae_BoGa-3]